MQIANTKDGKRLYINDFKKGVDEAYCPICNEKLIARQGAVMAWHYAHRPDSTCTYRNDDNAMSKWHMQWQECFLVEQREIVKTNEKGERRRADVLIEDEKLEIEFQHSPITEEEITKRNAFWNGLGYKTAWLFDCTEKDISGLFEPSSKSSLKEYVWDRPLSSITRNEVVDNKNNVCYLQLEENEIVAIVDCDHTYLSNFYTDGKFYTKDDFLKMLNHQEHTNIINRKQNIKDRKQKQFEKIRKQQEEAIRKAKLERQALLEKQRQEEAERQRREQLERERQEKEAQEQARRIEQYRKAQEEFDREQEELRKQGLKRVYKPGIGEVLVSIDEEEPEEDSYAYLHEKITCVYCGEEKEISKFSWFGGAFGMQKHGKCWECQNAGVKEPLHEYKELVETSQRLNKEKWLSHF